jgi:methylmalonyl-CoA/ethylmalonyl-CoA epimerase
MLHMYETLFRLKPTVVKEGMGGKLRIAFLPANEGEIELLQPVDTATIFGSFLSTHGEGIHHIALSTDNIESEIARLKKEGVAFDGDPRVGAHGVRIVFTKPETTGGMTFEIVEDYHEIRH